MNSTTTDGRRHRGAGGRSPRGNHPHGPTAVEVRAERLSQCSGDGCS